MYFLLLPPLLLALYMYYYNEQWCTFPLELPERDMRRREKRLSNACFKLKRMIGGGSGPMGGKDENSMKMMHMATAALESSLAESKRLEEQKERERLGLDDDMPLPSDDSSSDGGSDDGSGLAGRRKKMKKRYHIIG